MSQSWPAAIFTLLLIGGLGRSLSFAPMGTLVFTNVPKPRLTAANVLSGNRATLMKALGMTVAAGPIQATMLVSGNTHTARWQLGCGFLVTVLVVITSLPMFLRLPAEAGAGISSSCPKRAERT